MCNAPDPRPVKQPKQLQPLRSPDLPRGARRPRGGGDGGGTRQPQVATPSTASGGTVLGGGAANSNTAALGGTTRFNQLGANMFRQR